MIKLIHFNELNAGAKLPDKTKNLVTFNLFVLDKIMVRKYTSYAKQFFEGIK